MLASRTLAQQQMANRGVSTAGSNLKRSSTFRLHRGRGAQMEARTSLEPLALQLSGRDKTCGIPSSPQLEHSVRHGRTLLILPQTE
jgi:hypothetical protein